MRHPPQGTPFFAAHRSPPAPSQACRHVCVGARSSVLPKHPPACVCAAPRSDERCPPFSKVWVQTLILSFIVHELRVHNVHKKMAEGDDGRAAAGAAASTAGSELDDGCAAAGAAASTAGSELAVRPVGQLRCSRVRPGVVRKEVPLDLALVTDPTTNCLIKPGTRQVQQLNEALRPRPQAQWKEEDMGKFHHPREYGRKFNPAAGGGETSAGGPSAAWHDDAGGAGSASKKPREVAPEGADADY